MYTQVKETINTDTSESLHPSIRTTRDELIRSACITAGVGATVGAILGTVKEMPLISSTLSMGFTWGAGGYLYFATRHKLDHYLSPYVSSDAPYTFWYPTLLTSFAAATTGTASTVLIGRPIPMAFKNGGSLAVIFGLTQLGIVEFRRLRQDALLIELKTHRTWKEQWQDAIQLKFDQLKQWTQQTAWLPIRFISDEECFHRLSIDLAKEQHAMQKYSDVMDVLKERIQVLKKQSQESGKEKNKEKEHHLKSLVLHI